MYFCLFSLPYTNGKVTLKTSKAKLGVRDKYLGHMFVSFSFT